MSLLVVVIKAPRLSYPRPFGQWCHDIAASNFASSRDPIGGQLALHPGSAKTRPTTIPESTTTPALAFFLTDIGFTHWLESSW
jgi:hypothetical protein